MSAVTSESRFLSCDPDRIARDRQPGRDHEHSFGSRPASRLEGPAQLFARTSWTPADGRNAVFKTAEGMPSGIVNVCRP
jgi:hypothetical protein